MPAKKTKQNEEKMVEEINNEKAEIQELVEEKIEDIKPSKKHKKEEIQEKPIIKSSSLKEIFLSNILQAPYSIYQNGILICHYDINNVIKANDKYFEVNGKKYTYLGIEIKYA